MPAKSNAQRIAIAIAEHDPGKLNPANKGLLSMKQSDMHDFASTPSKGLPQHVGRKYYGDGQLSDAFGSNVGGLHRATHTPEGEPIPPGKVKAAAHSDSSHVRHMAQADLNMNRARYYGSK